MRRALALAAISVALVLATGLHAAEKTTLEGSYTWDGGGSSGPLKAVFTPTETAGQWDVAFYFDFRDRARTYRGTAEGSLTLGELTGTVMNEKKRRTFTFTGTTADGKFSGTHAEIYKRRSRPMGKLTLNGD